ncbi:hypothetical protein ABFS82_04G128700 [Erythranthe guttata]|uniref:DUF4228 domain-containing protein n=1 Tax=Erythranthe guttata TaxID=4155 RepID=A0A022RIW6_ERYGU|nr:PREDICTED: uncharacterized protein LOC105954717 [Erythranthe guttata]EYU40372.1 hypothetical protein MIMGU_mgv1a026017mg [Erythranthe guttata]|eukprot:XP_012833852.1 PREDICTED: uncharacterized protein LOC105954717 [Erythranthe guttata]
MGNVALCAPSITSNGVAKVLTIDGRQLTYTREPAIKAAEIMLENPGQFLCESNQLIVGQRIPGICAEEELEVGHVYFLLPMELLYSVLTDDEKKILSHKYSKEIMKLKISKIFPEFCLFPNGNSDSSMEESAEIGSQLVKRYSRQRSWQPALETIVETPP